MSYTKVIEDIKNLPHYREFVCSTCGHQQKSYTLTIQKVCEKCGNLSKLRGYGSIGSEVEDVIDAVLAWIGKEGELDNAMEWKQVIDSS